MAYLMKVSEATPAKLWRMACLQHGADKATDADPIAWFRHEGRYHRVNFCRMGGPYIQSSEGVTGLLSDDILRFSRAQPIEISQ